MRPHSPAIGLALIALVPRVALAEGTAGAAVALAFENTSTEVSCPTEQELRDRVAARLGRDPFVSGAALTIKVSFRDDRDKVRAEIRRIEGVAEAARVNGRRELSAPRRECGDLGESIAVAVSVILEPRASAGPLPVDLPPSAPVVVAPTEEAFSRSPVTAPIDQGQPVASRRWSPSLAIGPQASIGRGPAVTVGARLGGSLGISGWTVGLEAMSEWSTGFTAVAVERLRVSVVAGGLVVCRTLGAFFACVVSSIGVVTGELANIDAPTTRQTLASTLGPRFGASLRASPSLSFEPTLDVLASLVRTRAELDDGTLWFAPPVVFSLGLLLRLGS